MNILNGFRKWAKSVDWKDFLTWEFLRNPVAICFAFTCPIILAMGLAEVDSNETLDVVWIATTVILIMVFGTAEEVLVQTILRVSGLLVGLTIGGVVAYLNNVMLDNGVSTVARDAYQICLQVLVVFVCVSLYKLFPQKHDFLLTISIGSASLVFSPDWTKAWSRGASILLGGISASVFTTIFYYTYAEDFLFEKYRKSASLLLDLAQHTLALEPENVKDFNNHAETIRDCLRACDSVWRAYTTWRSYTFRRIRYNFEFLTESFRPFYYETFSVYWSHVEINIRPTDAMRYYCNTVEEFNVHFKPIRDRMSTDIERSKELLMPLLRRRFQETGSGALQLELTELVNAFKDLQSNYHCLADKYIGCRSGMFSSRQQRWNMADYLICLSSMLVEMGTYVKAVILVVGREVIESEQLVETVVSIQNEIVSRRFSAVGVEEQPVQ